jgi:hypothetical protein
MKANKAEEILYVQSGGGHLKVAEHLFPCRR